MNDELSRYKHIYLYDFEFDQSPDWLPRPLCLVALDLCSGEYLRLWGRELQQPAPYPLGDESLFIAYTISAEHSCHRALGWKYPAHAIDFFIEFQMLTNGLLPKGAPGLLDALLHFGLPSLDFTTKQRMRNEVLRGGPYSRDQREAILAYCQSDVDALAALYPKLMPEIIGA